MQNVSGVNKRTVQAISTSELGNVTGGQPPGPAPSLLSSREPIHTYGRPDLWRQECARAKGILSNGKPPTLNVRNIARDYANQSAQHGRPLFAAPTAENILSRNGLE
jgi:hypothetical protein